MKQTVPKVLPPVRDELEDLTTHDLQIIFDKVKIYRLAPTLMRVSLGLMYLLMAAFVFGYDGGLGLLIGFSVLFLVAWLLGEWGLKHYMGLLKDDLEQKKKRVVEGALTERFQRASAAGLKGKNGSHYWVIGEEKYRVEAADYANGKLGDRVQVEILPQSGLVFQVAVWSGEDTEA